MRDRIYTGHNTAHAIDPLEATTLIFFDSSNRDWVDAAHIRVLLDFIFISSNQTTG